MTNFLPAKMRPGHDCRTFDPRGLYNAGHVLTIDFLGSGSSGNATLIRWDSTALLVDCGFGPRVLRRRLEQAGVPHTPLVTPGPHDYAWNRGPGSVETLLWYDRALRGEAHL